MAMSKQVKKPRSTADQARHFYGALARLAEGESLPADHPLLSCPADPFSKGQEIDEKRAVQALHTLVGNWDHDLRRLYYGYRQSRRLQTLHIGIAFLSMEDDELRQLLRSHPGDETLFPHVFFRDEMAERRHRQRLRQLDSKEIA
jgi:hypothetical protein